MLLSIAMSTHSLKQSKGPFFQHTERKLHADTLVLYRYQKDDTNR